MKMVFLLSTMRRVARFKIQQLLLLLLYLTRRPQLPRVELLGVYFDMYKSPGAEGSKKPQIMFRPVQHLERELHVDRGERRSFAQKRHHGQQLYPKKLW